MATTTTDTATALRAWARRMYPLEAAAELVIRAFHGKLLHGPWVKKLDGDRAMLDTSDDAMYEAGVLSSGEQRVLDIAASLADGEYRVALTDVLSGFDREHLELVLAAVAHAGGSHEHAHIEVDHEAGVAYNHGRHPSLFPWPDSAQ